MKGFLNDLYLRPSCYSCPSKSGKSNSDITIADYWSIDQVKPEFNDKKGVGLLLINSIKGETFFPFECTDYIETSYEDAKGLNGGFKESIKIPSKRKYFFAHLDSTPQVSRLIEKSIIPSIGERIKRKLISFIYKPKS